MRLMQVWLAALLVAGCQTVVDPVPEGTLRVTEALARKQPTPLLSPIYGKALDTDSAYRIQHAVLVQQLQGRAPIGFKGGLTSPAAQQQFGATEPVAGVLLPGSTLRAEEDGYHVQLRNYRQPMAEVEVGFRVAQRISRTLPDVESLQAHLGEILPAVELPDLAGVSAHATPPQAVDIVVANAYAGNLITGPARAPGLTDPNAVAVTLYRDGEVLTQGGGRDVLGDQWQALLWLVNRVIDSGWTIEPGQILITGAMGKPVPLQRGLYVADFGRFGVIEWMVE